MINNTKTGRMIAKEIAAIEFALQCHGGNTKILHEKALILAKMSTLSIKQAVYQVIKEDRKTRKAPIGFYKEKSK